MDCHNKVSKLLHLMSGKSSPLDFILTSLLKLCSILIAGLANLSFTQGIFPSKFKLAQISPLLKKPRLSKSDPSNFRPISNLIAIGRILDCLAYWLASFLIFPFPPPSSSFHFHFRQFFTPLVGISKVHSTETAFLKLMISWTPLIQERSQFLLLLICGLLLTLWTTPPSFIGLNIHSVCLELSTPGFTHT